MKTIIQIKKTKINKLNKWIKNVGELPCINRRELNLKIGQEWLPDLIILLDGSSGSVFKVFKFKMGHGDIVYFWLKSIRHPASKVKNAIASAWKAVTGVSCRTTSNSGVSGSGLITILHINEKVLNILVQNWVNWNITKTCHWGLLGLVCTWYRLGGAKAG